MEMGAGSFAVGDLIYNIGMISTSVYVICMLALAIRLAFVPTERQGARDRERVEIFSFNPLRIRAAIMYIAIGKPLDLPSRLLLAVIRIAAIVAIPTFLVTVIISVMGTFG